MRYFPVVLLFPIASCAQPEQGKKTVFCGSDGKTITSVVMEFNDQEYADIEREKTRQECYASKALGEKAILKQIGDNPYAMALIAQTKALNNALSLATTGKNYDPCPSSTNSQDAEIESSKTYQVFWKEGFSFAGTATLVGLTQGSTS